MMKIRIDIKNVSPAAVMIDALRVKTRLCIVLLGFDVSTIAWPFAYVLHLCVRAARALARLRACAGSSEYLLLANALSADLKF